MNKYEKQVALTFLVMGIMVGIIFAEGILWGLK